MSEYEMKGTDERVYRKQPRIVDEALPFIPSRRTVIQAGAHVGVWPHKLAQHFEQVVAFEPRLDSWQVASESAAADNVMIILGALSDKLGHGYVNGQAIPCGGSSVVGEEGDPVPVYTIDRLPLYIRSSIDAIFLDIEGHEVKALFGAVETIYKNHPVLVLEDEGKWNHEDLHNVLPIAYKQMGSFFRDSIWVAR